MEGYCVTRSRLQSGINKKDKFKKLNDVVYPTIRISQPATRWSCFVKKEH